MRPRNQIFRKVYGDSREPFFLCIQRPSSKKQQAHANPTKKRAADKREALIVMIETMGDTQFTTSRFSPSQIECESLAPTTWRELVAEASLRIVAKSRDRYSG